MKPAARLAQPDNVVELADGIVEGADYPLVPEGEYLATYMGHEVVEMRQFRRAPKLFLRVQLVDAGQYTGTRLFRSYRVRRRIDGRRFVVGKRSDLVKTIARVLGVPPRPDRISLSALKHCLLRIRVKTVTHDADQEELPPSMRYSVVDDIVAKETG